MRKLLLILSFGPVFLLSKGQIIDPSSPQDFHSNPVFNANFLAANGIVGIQIDYHTKRDGSPMVPRSESDAYDFDTTGRPTSHLRIRQFVGAPDTSLTFFWASDCYTAIERHSRYLAATRTCPDGDQSRVEKFTLSRWPSKEEDLKEYRLTELFSEQVKTEPSNGLNHTYTYSNNLGLPYKRMRYIQNEAGYQVAEITEWVVSGETAEKRFFYDRMGRLETIEHWSGKEKTGTFTLKWDGASNLLSIEEQDRGKHFLTEIVYGSDALIHSYIRINRETNEMIIARFRYQYSLKS